MWVSMKEMKALAKPGKSAIGAFHAANLEQAQGILEAGVETRSPVIVAVDRQAVMYAGVATMVGMVRELAREVPVPVAMELDRVVEVDFIENALSLGFTGVLADSRDEPEPELVKRLKRIKEICAGRDAFFEGEIKEPRIADAATMDFAGRIIAELDPDSVCVTVPRSERKHPSEEFFKVVSKIVEFTDVPLSLAGAGAWPDQDLERAVILGVWKFSVGTRTNTAFTDGLKQFLADNPERVHPRSYLGFAREVFRKEVATCIRAFGGGGKD